MSVEVALCPLCGALQSNLFDRRIAQTQTITNRLCSECGLVYQSPRMSGSELEAFYQKEYRQLYQGDQEPTAKDLKVQSLRASSLLAFARVRIPSVSRHLDIGCSAGLLLQQFQTAYCSQPAGVEPGAAYRQYARGLGLSVYASLEELRTENQAPFDLVSMAHVLEHIPEPVAYLENLRSNLHHWRNRQSLAAAVAIALRNRVDLRRIAEWSEREGARVGFQEFARDLKSAKQSRRRPTRPPR